MHYANTPLKQLKRHSDFLTALLAPFTSASASDWVLPARADGAAEHSGTGSAITQAFLPSTLSY